MEQTELLSDDGSMSVDRPICSDSESLNSWSPGQGGSESLEVSDTDIIADEERATPVPHFGSGMAGANQWPEITMIALSRILSVKQLQGQAVLKLKKCLTY